MSNIISTEDLCQRYGKAYMWYVTFTVMVGLISMVAASTIINVAMPDIMGEFGLGQDQAQWLSTGFIAAMTASMLIATWSVQNFGRRMTYQVALIVFILGSIIGALSPNAEILIFARILQGAAAGVAQPVGMLTIFQVFPPEKRGSAMGIYGLGVILAPALGPTIGGMLIDNYSWRYVFALGPPFCLVGMFLTSIFLPNTRQAQRKPFDWLGFILLCIGIATFLTGLANGQRIGWDSNFVWMSFGIALICGIAFIVQEKRSPNPILALEVFSNPRFLAASTVAFILGLGLYGSTYLVPLFVQTIQGYTPTESGLLLMPAGIVLGFVFPTAGKLSDRIAPHILIIIGLIIFGISNFLMSHADSSTDFWSFAFWVALGRIGLGFILPSLNGGALKVLDSNLVSHGSGAINFIRQLGGAIGVDLLSVYLERQTTISTYEYNAMQDGNPTAKNAIHTLAILLHRGGWPGWIANSQASKFVAKMIESQGSVLGFRASFLLVATIFFIALIPVWAMKPQKKV